MIIYVLKHENPKFSGSFFGVGFSKGRGSTSSKPDRDRCIQNGCKDISQQIKASEVAKEKKADLKAKKTEEKAKKEADKKAVKADPEYYKKEEESKEEEDKAEEPEKEDK